MRLRTGLGVIFMLGMLAAAPMAMAAGPAPIQLGAAAPFAVLAGTPAVTSAGTTAITGDIGISPGSTVTGFPPGTVSGAIHAADAVALQAKRDLVTAYDDAAGRPGTGVLAGAPLDGAILKPGVWNASFIQLNIAGTLTLDGQGDPNSVWIFQSFPDLVTASSSEVRFINAGQPCNVFWQVSGPATLGPGSTFAGTIMALGSITIGSGVTMDGRALAINGEVTMTDSTIVSSTCSQLPNAAYRGGETPRPGSLLVLMGALALLLALLRIGDPIRSDEAR